MSAETAGTAGVGGVLGVDHIALPMAHPDAMVAFYRSLGLPVVEGSLLVQVHLGDQMVNFHRPELWRGEFELRAPAASPPCGDVCLVWDGSAASLAGLLHRAGAEIIEGPVPREGARRVTGSSVYIHDPDGNLIEFMSHPDDAVVADVG